MSTNQRAVAPTGELRRASTGPRSGHRCHRGLRLTSWAVVALVLFGGGQMARARVNEGAPAVTPIAVENTAFAKPTTPRFSARALVAQAEANLADGHPGQAILEYERARLIAPRAPTVTTGLSRAQSIAGVRSPDPSLATRAMRYLDPDEWGWVAMAGLILAGAGAVAVAWGLIRRRGFMALALTGVIAAGLGILGTVEVTPGPNSAVVVAGDTVARIAPFAKADEAFSVPEGSLVTVERTYGHYVLIAGAEGRGWVPERGVELILPGEGKRS
jgi:hypothetical protein